MKKFFSITIVAVIAAFVLAPAAQARVNVAVGVGIGGGCYRGGGFYGNYCGGGWGYYGYPGYCSRPYYYYPSPVVYPAYVPTTTYYVNDYSGAPVSTAAPVTAAAPESTTSASSAPYGFPVGAGQIKSPWSDFVTTTGGKSSGQVIYDSNNGKPFRIP